VAFGVQKTLIFLKHGKIGLKLLLRTNRKSHIRRFVTVYISALEILTYLLTCVFAIGTKIKTKNKNKEQKRPRMTLKVIMHSVQEFDVDWSVASIRNQ